MHTVAVLALDDVIPFDLATPVQTFGFTRLADGSPAYRVLVCGPSTIKTEAFTMQTHWGLDALADADTIVVPGCDTREPTNPEALDALRAAAAKGTRIA